MSVKSEFGKGATFSFCIELKSVVDKYFIPEVRTTDYKPLIAKLNETNESGVLLFSTLPVSTLPLPPLIIEERVLQSSIHQECH